MAFGPKKLGAGLDGYKELTTALARAQKTGTDRTADFAPRAAKDGGRFLEVEERPRAQVASRAATLEGEPASGWVVPEDSDGRH